MADQQTPAHTPTLMDDLQWWWWFNVQRRCTLEKFTIWLAWKLPRRVALWAFIRVYGCIGECGPDYARVYDAWQSGKGR